MQKKIITENDYPVEGSWVLKMPISTIITTIIILLFVSTITIPIMFTAPAGIFILFFIFAIVIFIMFFMGFLSIIIAGLSRDNFHYSVEEEFMIFHQGVITKQQKNLPYGVIQDLIVSQDIGDRILGLSSLTIENAAMGAGQIMARRQAGALIGFSGNVAVIPGLTKKNAEELKGILLEKIRKNASVDRKSGL